MTFATKALACIAALAMTAPALAQTAPAASAPAAPAAATRLNLDTPIETIVADPAGKAALDASIPGLTAHPAFEQFKAMSLRQLQPVSQGALSDELLASVGTALAAVQ